MCEKSTQWQGDGWGIGFKKSDGNWKIQKSLNPVWQDTHVFEQIPQSTTFVAHARGASFVSQKGNSDYNQPFTNSNNVCFVFNGEMYGVKLKAPGNIGSQKIFSLITKELIYNPPEKALKQTSTLLRAHSRDVLAINIALVVDDTIYVSSYFTKQKKYYTLQYYDDNNITIVCSQKIGNYKWKEIANKEIIKL